MTSRKKDNETQKKKKKKKRTVGTADYSVKWKKILRSF